MNIKKSNLTLRTYRHLIIKKLKKFKKATCINYYPYKWHVKNTTIQQWTVY